MENVRINIYEAIGGDGAISVDDGEDIYKRLEKALDHGAYLTLDFNNIKLITSAFLNAAIGQLYGKYETEFIRKRMKLENVAQEDINTFKKVTDRAKEYFLDKESFNDSLQNELGDE